MAGATSRTPPLPHLVPRLPPPFFSGNVAQLQLPVEMTLLRLDGTGVTGTFAVGPTSPSNLPTKTRFEVWLVRPVRRSLIPHLVPLSSLSPFPGNVAQLQLPAEMQRLDLGGTGVTGTSR